MKIIGITGNNSEEEGTTYLNHAYTNAFQFGHVIPLIIPSFNFQPKDFEVNAPIASNEALSTWAKTIINKIDALVVSGGVDINPLTYNKENSHSYGLNMARDLSEKALVMAAIERGIPVLGICRGMQLIGNLLGIPNYQQELGAFDEVHSSSERVGTRYEPVHQVTLLGNLKIFASKFFGGEVSKLQVNSFHHQGFTFNDKPTAYNKAQIGKMEVDAGIKILAHTDQVIEAFEVADKDIMGVQWHPEEIGHAGIIVQYFMSKVFAPIKLPAFS